jgi:hypothetical protein
MSSFQSVAFAALVTAITGCGVAEQPPVNIAELLVETQDVVAGLREELAGFQDQIDSLHVQLAYQDSLIRVLANLQGMPLPPKPQGVILP